MAQTGLDGDNRGRDMSSELTLLSDSEQPPVYQIRIKGHLGPQWTDWFDGLTLTLEDTGETLLIGPVADQAALHGVLKKVRDLGMPLLSVVCVALTQAVASDVSDVQHPRERGEGEK